MDAAGESAAAQVAKARSLSQANQSARDDNLSKRRFDP
jgi:hypothetical protein